MGHKNSKIIDFIAKVTKTKAEVQMLHTDQFGEVQQVSYDLIDEKSGLVVASIDDLLDDETLIVTGCTDEFIEKLENGEGYNGYIPEETDDGIVLRESKKGGNGNDKIC